MIAGITVTPPVVPIVQWGENIAVLVACSLPVILEPTSANAMKIVGFVPMQQWFVIYPALPAALLRRLHRLLRRHPEDVYVLAAFVAMVVIIDPVLTSVIFVTSLNAREPIVVMMSKDKNSGSIVKTLAKKIANVEGELKQSSPGQLSRIANPGRSVPLQRQLISNVRNRPKNVNLNVMGERRKLPLANRLTRQSKNQSVEKPIHRQPRLSAVFVGENV